MRFLIVLIFIFSQLGSIAQTNVSAKVTGTEFGIDGFFGASSLGGSFGIGTKYGWNFGENFIVGPSLRYQRYWSNNFNTSESFGFNAFGLGGFVHGRLANSLFAGAELEFMRTPVVSGGYYSYAKKVVPSLFVGGGFSREFKETVRINAGIYIDIIDNMYSPFRQGYFMKRANGTFIPAIYRITFFFPLYRPEKETPEDVEEVIEETIEE